MILAIINTLVFAACAVIATTLVVVATINSINGYRLRELRKMDPSQVRFTICTLDENGPYQVSVVGTDKSGSPINTIKAASERFGLVSSAEKFVENFFSAADDKKKFPKERPFNPHIKAE